MIDALLLLLAVLALWVGIHANVRIDKLLHEKGLAKSRQEIKK